MPFDAAGFDLSDDGPATPAEILTAVKKQLGNQSSQVEVMPPGSATFLSPEFLPLLAILLGLAAALVLLAYWFS